MRTVFFIGARPDCSSSALAFPSHQSFVKQMNQMSFSRFAMIGSWRLVQLRFHVGKALFHLMFTKEKLAELLSDEFAGGVKRILEF